MVVSGVGESLRQPLSLIGQDPSLTPVNWPPRSGRWEKSRVARTIGKPVCVETPKPVLRVMWDQSMKQGTLWRGLSSTVSTGPLLLSPACLLAACSTTNSQTDRGTQTIRFAPRALAKNLGPSDYYPDASLRAGETGEVILHFHIGSDGIAQAPFVVDEATKAVPRLIEEAQKMLTDTHYESGERYRHEVTASVLFEIIPDCGKLQSTPRIDYHYRLCVPPINLREPSVSLPQNSHS